MEGSSAEMRGQEKGEHEMRGVGWCPVFGVGNR